MPRRELLTEPQRLIFNAPASDERGMVRHYTLSAEDLALINRHRGDSNRLGFAVMLCYLRFPGRILQQGEQPPAALCVFVAEQLGLDPVHFGDYAERDQTRREHILEIQTALGLSALTRSMYREIAVWLLPTALATDDGPTLVAAVLEELRSRRIVCPPLPAIERVGAMVRARAQRQLWRRLTDGLTDQQRQALDQLLEVRTGGGQSTLAWLRQTAYAATAGNFPKLIERLNRLRALGIESERATRVHQNYWLKLAREGGQCTVQHLAELEPLCRHATLTSLALDLTATLTDEAFNMFEHLIGKLFKKSERAHTEQFHASGKSINEKVRLYVRVGQALINARSSGGDPFAAIEAVLPWSKFESTVAEAETLAQPEEFDYLALLDERYSSLRKFAPLLLAHFEFHAAPAATELLQALALLRDLNASGKRTLPEHVPTGFVKPRWRAYVFTADGVDRHFYELCALAELRDRLRAGDIWVTGSRQYRDFETYLIPAATFKTMQEEPLPLAIDNAQALAGLIDAQHRQPLAAHWGDGTTSSSDAQFFRAGGRGEVGGLVNLHYGQDPGVKFYTHLSDQFGPLHTKVIDATANEAPHVLDGLLYHKSSLVINEHYTDTGGFSDHVFAMCRLLGFRFAPRIRDLKEKRLYTLPGMTVPPELVSLVAGAINLRAISDHWFELLRLATSIKTGTVTASVILRKLAAYPRQNGLAHALRELGKLERTLFTLDWLQDPELRRRSHVGLNKGEQQNALRRAVFFNRLGEIRDRSYENQLHRASGLNLLVAAIILWNTVYLQRAVDHIRKQGRHPAPVDLAHLSPLGWEHINLTGDYHWDTSPTLGPDQFRPLRTRSHDLAAA